MHNPELLLILNLLILYSLMGPLIFFFVSLKEDEFNLYRQIFDIIYKSIPKPDLYVYLHQDVIKLKKNISKRGRDYEQGISNEYLTRLQDGYFDFFKQQNDIPFLIIDINNLDFVENQADYEKIKSVIFAVKYEKGIQRVII